MPRHDEQLLESWVASLISEHSRRNFETTGRRFLSLLPEGGLRAATVEDVRDVLVVITRDVSEAAVLQYVLRIKSLLDIPTGSTMRPSTLVEPSECDRTPATAMRSSPSGSYLRSKSPS